jgi:hypothetical protein
MVNPLSDNRAILFEKYACAPMNSDIMVANTAYGEIEISGK